MHSCKVDPSEGNHTVGSPAPEGALQGTSHAFLCRRGPSSAQELAEALDPRQNSAKPWRDLWSAGHGVGSIKDIPTVASLVARLKQFPDSPGKHIFEYYEHEHTIHKI